MKYLNAFLKGEEISQHPREEAPREPRKPVSAVFAGAPGRDTGENEQVSTTQPPDYRGLYRQMAELVSGDCWSIDPTWWLDHPAQWEQIRDLDEQLTILERTGVGEGEYRTALAQMIKLVLVCHARALSEQGREHAGERAA